MSPTLRQKQLICFRRFNYSFAPSLEAGAAWCDGVNYELEFSEVDVSLVDHDVSICLCSLQKWVAARELDFDDEIGPALTN